MMDGCVEIGMERRSFGELLIPRRPNAFGGPSIAPTSRHPPRCAQLPEGRLIRRPDTIRNREEALGCRTKPRIAIGAEAVFREGEAYDNRDSNDWKAHGVPPYRVNQSAASDRLSFLFWHLSTPSTSTGCFLASA
jgi:hypothetical protein